MIGCDGNIYEGLSKSILNNEVELKNFLGRNFDIVGSVVYGYNKSSISIAFVGTFMTNSPPERSLELCKLLIQKGVDEGYIEKNYKLLGHCQLSTTESPGKMLFEEIKTWPHFALNP